jgi:hypothetical protein
MVLRLALIYAVMSYQNNIDVEQLEAALAVWNYCDESARYIFGETGSGSYLADRILPSLKKAGVAGMTRTEISSSLNNNYQASAVTKALEHLRNLGLAERMTSPPDGHPGRQPERWFCRD